MLKRIFSIVILFILSTSLIASLSCSSIGASEPSKQNLVNGIITVNAGQYYNVPFNVTNKMKDVRVTGSFKASGGSGNDIIALIMDDMAFTNWRNGHQASAIYNSGQLTIANINVSITSPGQYDLVFSNAFSWLISKQVSTTIDLTYR